MSPVETPTALELAVTQSVRSPNTQRNYMSSVHSFLNFAGRDPMQWTGARVVEWMTSLRDGREDQTVNTMLRAVRFASKRAKALGHIHHDFAAAADSLRVVREKRRDARPVEDARKIMAECAGDRPPDIRDRAILALGFYHGMRRESIAQLAVHDLNWGREQLTFIIKGGRRHTAPFDPRAQAAVQAWIACCLDVEDAPITGRLFRACHKGVDDVWAIREPLSGDAIASIVRRRAAAAGVPGFHSHLMRHCFISWAFEAGHSLEEIMLVTGHRDPSSVLEYRTELRGEGVRPKRLVPNLSQED